MHLVTGGSGFLGAGLVRALLARGDRVRIIDDHSRGRPRRLDGLDAGLEVLVGDVRDADFVRSATEGSEIVWHLAYINGTKHFYERPDDVLDVGIRGTLNTIDAALDAGAKRYVFASTSETYNRPTHVPTNESERLLIPDVLNPRFSYGGGKIAGELLTLHLAGRRGLETIIVRPHNIYGPDMGFAHVIPEIVQKILKGSDGGKKREITLPIQGDGSETRAFCHIDDGADGFMAAGLRGQNGEIYHLGREEEVSIRSLLLKIGAIMGVRLALEPGPLRAGGTPRRCPDTTKLSTIGYTSRVPLEQGLTETVQWYVEHFRATDSWRDELEP
ncbi:MAG: NAD-dependent epimerase/dehydratase family protein [Myxococcota bacterium]|nr:NAD-dependent epimerase/dehydratase family protein [Myxococcota bacterium]